MQDVLYPPVMRAMMPAFVYTQGCDVYFSISDYNTIDQQNSESSIDSNKVQVVVLNQKSNQSVLDDNYPTGIIIKSLQINNNINGKNKYYIHIDNADIKNGFNINEYYKVQIRFTSKTAQQGALNNVWLSQNLDHFSQWSTVTLIYGISQPSLSLKNFQLNTINTFNFKQISVIGKVIFNSEDLEKIQQYQISLYKNKTNKLLQQSGVIYNNSYNNINEINYIFKYDFQRNVEYYFKIKIITKNGYIFISDSYVFKIQENEQTISKLNFSISENNKDGYIEIIIKKTSQQQINENTYFTIRRTSSVNNFNYWEQIGEYQITKSEISEIKCLDYTVEPGVWYKYSIIKKQNSDDTVISTFTIEQPKMVVTQDIFLIAEDEQLKIRFDPQIANFSIKTTDILTETLGSKYPFFKRNGNLAYKTFSLSGTISYLMDVYQNVFNGSTKDLYKESEKLYREYNQINNISPFYDFIHQKQFRKKVIDFFYKNNIKLFRSLTQGNMLIKISDISLTPNNSLGRLIYSFSCTAYQIDQNNFENYKKYNTNLIKYKIK